MRLCSCSCGLGSVLPAEGRFPAAKQLYTAIRIFWKIQGCQGSKGTPSSHEPITFVERNLFPQGNEAIRVILHDQVALQLRPALKQYLIQKHYPGSGLGSVTLEGRGLGVSGSSPRRLAAVGHSVSCNCPQYPEGPTSPQTLGEQYLLLCSFQWSRSKPASQGN